MPKPIALVLLLALCGCGARSEQKKTSPRPRRGAPPIYLVTAAGRHRLVAGSSCVESPTVARCGDSGYVPAKVLYPVRRGETVRLEIAADTRGPDLAVGRPGCPMIQLADERLNVPGLEWHVGLRPGDYELRVVIDHFETADGLRGDVSGQIGIRVGGARTVTATARPC
jgi:hypothetical protein